MHGPTTQVWAAITRPVGKFGNQRMGVRLTGYYQHMVGGGFASLPGEDLSFSF